MLVDLKAASAAIDSGKTLFLAGDESLLARLPKGDWIGGTIPYFMGDEGGVIAKDKIFVSEAPAFATDRRISFYGEAQLPNIPRDAPENGFTVLIIPATSAAHVSYAKNAPNYEGLFMKPIIGWISGVHLDDLGKKSPKVFDGRTGITSSTEAIAMHLSLPKGKMASIGIVNLFKPGQGEDITFEEESFEARDCLVNGAKRNFAEYLVSSKIDSRLPLVADYNGTMVNVSFQSVDADKGVVTFYAPVFKGVRYRIAAPVADYVTEFTAAMPVGEKNVVFACNCILNFLYSELEGKKTGAIIGPITFGEIAYQLLNQTLTYLEVLDAS
jgi:hypothetical protein